MSEKLLGKHNKIKRFKCIECEQVLPESSRFQDKPVCVICVAESGYKNLIDEASDEKEIVWQKGNEAADDLSGPRVEVGIIDETIDEANTEKEIMQQEDEAGEAETSDDLSGPRVEVGIIDETIDEANTEKEITQQEDEAAEAETSDDLSGPRVEVGIIDETIDEANTEKEIMQQEERKAIVEKNIKNEKVMGISMIEETDWVAIATGEFLMGSLDADEDSDEQLHDVKVSEFKILKTAVTFEQFDVFCKETGKGKYSDNKWGRGNRPVVFVNYWDAVDYAKWLSGVTGWQCRLPTEAEWEYACRAGTETLFNTGDTITTAQANYDGASPHLMISKGISRHKTVPTKTFPSNASGLFEMHGNVYEWCASEYDPYYNGSEQLDGSTDRSNDLPRVLRGGSWNSRLENLRSAARVHSHPENRSNEWGFRLVRID